MPIRVSKSVLFPIKRFKKKPGTSLPTNDFAFIALIS